MNFFFWGRNLKTVERIGFLFLSSLILISCTDLLFILHLLSLVFLVLNFYY